MGEVSVCLSEVSVGDFLSMLQFPLVL